MLQLLDRLRHQHSQLEQVHTARLARFRSLYAALRHARDVLGPDALDPALTVPPSDDASLDDLSADMLARVQKEANRCEDEIVRLNSRSR